MVLLPTNPRKAFVCLAIATWIDSTDGTLARHFRVKEVLPQFDGARLDDIVDYLNYVVVPVVLASAAGLLPPGQARWLIAALPLVASGYGFCQTDAKPADHFFKGFPSYWNVVVLYLYVLGLGPAVNAVVLVGLVALVFVPTGYVYPSRTPAWRVPTLVLGALWAALVAGITWMLPAVVSLQDLPIF